MRPPGVEPRRSHFVWIISQGFGTPSPFLCLKEIDLYDQESHFSFFSFNIQEDYQNLEMHALDMDAEISSLQEALVTSIAEKDEALSKVELMTSELEDLANKLNSTESERNSFSNEITLLVYITCLCKYI